MPKASVTIKDLKDSNYWRSSGSSLTCLICRNRSGQNLTFTKKSNAIAHAMTVGHLTGVMLADERARSSAPISRIPLPPTSSASADLKDYRPGTAAERSFNRSPSLKYTKVTIEDVPEEEVIPMDTDTFAGFDVHDSRSHGLAHDRSGDSDDSMDDASGNFLLSSLWADGSNGRGVLASWPDALDIPIHPQLAKQLKDGKPLFNINFDSSPWDELADEAAERSDDDLEMNEFANLISTSIPNTDVDADFFPWPSQSHLLTDALVSAPRLRFSRAQRRAMLAWARKLGAVHVPSLDRLMRTQQSVLESVGNPTKRFVSSKGSIFYINDIARALSMDYANPVTRSQMENYSVDSGDASSQVWNGTKMLFSVPCHRSTPTVKHNNVIYWVNEIAAMDDGTFFVPQRFYKEKIHADQMMAYGWMLKSGNDGIQVIAPYDDGQVVVPVSRFRGQLPTEHIDGQRQFFDKTYAFLRKITEAHPFRQKAGDRMVYAVPLLVFEDDVSGNVSKQWNKHYVIYLSNGNLPREMLDKEYCVRFVTSSPHASPMELMEGVKENIEAAAREGIRAFDCAEKSEILLLPYALFFPGDNPMQAELCSHSGLNCNYFCRTCRVGGTNAAKESDEGFATLFTELQLRDSNQTKQDIHASFVLATKPGATTKLDDLVSSGVRDSLTCDAIERVMEKGKELRGTGRFKGKGRSLPETELQRQLESMLNATVSGINPLLDMEGVDIHLDTPTEILHTVLLGVVKYFWGQTIHIIKKEDTLDTFRARLASLNSEGLNCSSINAEYMCKYSGSLIGRHFKTIAQIMEFVVYDLVPPDVLQTWRAIGTLVVLLWHTYIDNLEAYIIDLQKAIDDFLNLTAKCAPSILITKPKFHFLVHLPLYIRRFGPAIIFSTERYESFNSVFRLSCIHSNRQAPSRDSCETLAYVDTIKHILSGGYWFSRTHKAWVRAGSGVFKALEQTPEVRELLGLYQTPTPIIAGSITLHPPPKSRRRTRRVVRDPAEPVHSSATLETGLSEAQPSLVNSVGSENNDAMRVDDSTPLSDASLANPVRWAATACSTVAGVIAPASSFMLHAKTVTTESGDVAQVGSNIIYRWKDGDTVNTRVGRVLEILTPSAPNAGLRHLRASHICIEDMPFLGQRHPVLDHPCVELNGIKRLLTCESLVCTVNLQHDCQGSGCTSLVGVRLRQERLLSGSTRSLVKHEPTVRFILNTNSLHNYQQIAKVLPEHLKGNSIAFDNTSRLRADAAAANRKAKKEKKENKEKKMLQAKEKAVKGKKQGARRRKADTDEETDECEERERTSPQASLTPKPTNASSTSRRPQETALRHSNVPQQTRYSTRRAVRSLADGHEGHHSLQTPDLAPNDDIG